MLGRFADQTDLHDVWAKEDLSSTRYLDPELFPHTVRILKADQKLQTIANASSAVEQ